jgi:hypothetical protein
MRYQKWHGLGKAPDIEVHLVVSIFQKKHISVKKSLVGTTKVSIFIFYIKKR